MMHEIEQASEIIASHVPSQPNITVSLVHGTFATGSKWPKLEAALEALFGSDAVGYVAWSGRNTVSARLDGARQVEERLADLIRAKPHAHHFIVAHSHGGNVSLLALRNSEIRKHIAGVICLSTPFLICRPRLSPKWTGELYEAAAYLGPALLIFIGAFYATRRLDDILTTLAVAMPFIFGYLLIAHRWQEGALTFVQQVAPPDLSDVPLLVIRSPADEASLFLTTVQFMTRLLSALWTFFSLGYLKLAVDWIRAPHVRGWRKRFLRPTILSLLLWSEIGLLYAVVAIFLPGDLRLPTFVERPLMGSGLALFAIANLPFMVSAVMIAPVLLITALLLLSFGPGYSLYAPFVEVSVDTTPWVACEVEPLPWTDEGREGGAFYYHGKTHDDPRAVSRATDWMNRQVLARTRQGTI